MKNLVVVRCGKYTCHHRMMHPDSQYDVWELPYQPIQPHALTTFSNIVTPGAKFNSIYRLFSEKNDWLDYDYIWIPDDDISISHEGVNFLFQEASSDRAVLSQPSLDEQSYFTHPITLNHPFLRSRSTNFVEVMAPLFSRQALIDCLWSFAINRSGWGLEYLWERILNSTHKASTGKNLTIYDSVKVCHTRPVGGQSRGTGQISPYDELASLLAEWNLTISSYNLALNPHQENRHTSVERGSSLFIDLLASSCSHIVRQRSLFYPDNKSNDELKVAIKRYYLENIKP